MATRHNAVASDNPNDVRVIYKMTAGLSEDDPSIDTSVEPNTGYDWERLYRMLEMRTEPIDQGFMLSLNLFPTVPITGRDIVQIGWASGMMVSKKAKAVLESQDPDALLFYEMRVQGTPFWLMAVVRMCDCLDRGKSDLEFFPSSPNKVMAVRRYVFNTDVIPRTAIFRIPERRGITFVTEAVKRTIEGDGLSGFRFVNTTSLGEWNV